MTEQPNGDNEKPKQKRKGRIDKVKARYFAKARFDHPTSQVDAYMASHNCKRSTAQRQAYRFFKDERIVKAMDEMLNKAKAFNVSKETLVKIMGDIVDRWYADDPKVKTSDLNKTLEMLSKLVPEFVNRNEVRSYDGLTKDDLYTELKRKLGNLN